ncbi:MULTISPECIES: hypothetical protein [unclassified Paraflavitalea]|uniref:hypothetical protein n=1 Tax=unclassified Paraflavitalea TaxID=2798305 RepID=UPI003D3588F6
MREYGGYIELESVGNQCSEYHSGIRTKCGRASLNYILESVEVKKIYLPYYCCIRVLDPVWDKAIPYEFLEIDQNLELKELPKLAAGEYLIYVNFFGMKEEYISKLGNEFKDQLIIDNTQAYFFKKQTEYWHFNSCRKFFGVPDGSYLYMPHSYKLSQPTKINSEYKVEHLYKRILYNAPAGYQDYNANEMLLDHRIEDMSSFSRYHLQHIDQDALAAKRLSNFQVAHSILGNSNRFDTSAINAGLYYPFFPSVLVDKKRFFQRNIFISTLWGDLFERPQTDQFSFEKEISTYLIPIPIDHRYNAADIEHICSVVLELINT